MDLYGQQLVSYVSDTIARVETYGLTVAKLVPVASALYTVTMAFAVMNNVRAPNKTILSPGRLQNAPGAGWAAVGTHLINVLAHGTILARLAYHMSNYPVYTAVCDGHAIITDRDAPAMSCWVSISFILHAIEPGAIFLMQDYRWPRLVHQGRTDIDSVHAVRIHGLQIISMAPMGAMAIPTAMIVSASNCVEHALSLSGVVAWAPRPMAGAPSMLNKARSFTSILVYCLFAIWSAGPGECTQPDMPLLTCTGAATFVAAATVGMEYGVGAKEALNRWTRTKWKRRVRKKTE
jgi:hypothetical protein